MSATFLQLNQGWNAAPNAPCERVTIVADTVTLKGAKLVALALCGSSAVIVAFVWMMSGIGV